MKNKAEKEHIALLVRVYNHTIQSYDHFPDVIIYGDQRLERSEFEWLLQQELIVPHRSDSFGKLYHLSKKAEALLHDSLHHKRRQKLSIDATVSTQSFLQFS